MPYSVYNFVLVSAMKSESSVMSDSLLPHGLYLPGSSVHGIFWARILEWGAISFSRGSSRPGDQIEPVSPVSFALQVDALSTEPSGKPNYNVK